MLSTAVKTPKIVPVAPVKATGNNFFHRAGEQSFFGAKESPSFFGKPVQPKLTVSTPDDPHEKEADAVADKVMRMPEPAPVMAPAAPQVKEEKIARKEEEEVQAKPAPLTINKIQCKEDNEDRLHAKADMTAYRKQQSYPDISTQTTIGSETDQTIDRKNISLYHSDTIQTSGRGPPASSIPFEENLAASKGNGTRLPEDTRMFMESRFNADFTGVRVHTSVEAGQMNTQINAQAFAHGNDIYFSHGKFSPGSSGGKQLLAHELTHTIQQGASPVKDNAPAATPPRNTVSRAPNTAANNNAAAGIDLSHKTGGAALPAEAAAYFQHSFHADVSDIRVHTDDEAAGICRERKLPAFTQGRHICFDPAKYSPDSEAGGKLLSKQVSASLAQRSITVNKVKGKAPAPAKKTTINTDPKDKKKPAPKGKGGNKNKKGDGGKHKAKGKADKSDRPAVKSVKPNPKKSPSHPDEDPAFQKVIGKTKTTAKAQHHHDAAEAKSGDAQKASPAAPKEAESKAQERKTDGLDAAGKEDKPFDEKSFKADLLKKIEDVTPKTLEDATEFKENNKIGEVKNVMGDKVSGEKQNTTGPVTKASAVPVQANDADNKHPLPLPPTPKGPKPAGVGGTDAAPKSKLDNEIPMQEKSKSLDDEMKANNVTEDQLKASNEPSFSAAVDQKRGAQKDAVEKPKQYRKDEKQMLAQAKAVTQEQSAHAMTGMDVERGKQFGTVVQQQQSTKGKDQQTRASVAKNIEEKYAATEKIVTQLLDEADKESNRIFDEGAEAAKNAFENYVDAKMRAYKEDRYSGFWGGLSWLEDKIFGMPDEVNVFYTQGRQMYIDKMDQVIIQVASFVTGKLNAAKQAIKDGKKGIDDYVSKLPEDLQEVGKQAATDIQDKFDALEQNVNDKKDQLIEGLAKKYVDNVKKIDDRISEMKEANAGLIDAAIGFLKKVWKVIKDLTNLFTSILSKLASIIGTILSSPGGFFDNLGKAFKQGFNNFKNKFLDYLEQGLMDWLMTNLGIAGIELPKKFSPMAIFTLVLQVLGLTKAHIKERAVVILGPKTVMVLETAGGILYKVYNEGLGALWELIQEKLTDLKDVVWEAIKSFIKTKIIEAAIVFLLSMLNPIGAFVKVCMAIYDFLMMLVRFKDRIMELLDSILKAVTDVAAGAIDGAANAIEKAFAKSIPVIIGFLAALLHLNDIAAKVKDIITRIRARVDKAIDFVINKGVGLVKGAGKALGFGKDKDKPNEKTAENEKDVKKVNADVVVPFNMKGKSHTLTAKVQNQKVQIIMASEKPMELTGALQVAITHLKKEKPANWEELVKELKICHKEVESDNSMVEDFNASGGRIPGEKGSYSLEQYISRKLSIVTNKLFEIAIQHNITDLQSFFMDIPEKRYLPAGYDVRQKLYYRGGNWTSGSNVREKVFNEQLEQLRLKVIELKAKNDTNGFARLINSGKIPAGSILGSFNPDHIRDKTIKYAVDHVRPLSAHWERDNGNNSSDSGRWEEAVRENNLNVIHSIPNSSKGSVVGDDPTDRSLWSKWVGPEFTSIYANDNQPKSKIIDGQSFLLKENGPPIL